MSRRVLGNLDLALAILGVALGGGAAAWMLIWVKDYLNGTLLGYVALACLFYLALRPRLSGRTLTHLLEQDGPAWVRPLLDAAFFLGLSYLVLAHSLRAEPYSRPLGFFISIGLLSGLLAAEMVVVPRSDRADVVLIGKICLLGILVRLSPLTMFPGGIWFDPWYHQYFTQQIVSTSHIPDLGPQSYSKLAIMHLFLAVAMLLTGSDFKTSFMALVTPLQVVVQAVFVYLISRKFISGRRVGLLAALIVTMADVVVARGSVAYPTTIAGLLILPIIYLVFRARQDRSSSMAVLYLLLMATLILTHTIGSLAFALLLFCAWLASVAARWLLGGKHTLTTISVTALFLVSTVAWWMFASGHIISVARAIRWALQPEHFSAPTPIGATAYASAIPAFDVLLDRAGYSAFFAFAAIGCLFLTSKWSTGSPHGLALGVGGVCLGGLAFIGALLDLYILADRWYLFSQIVLATPTAIGVALVANSSRKRSVFVLSLLVAVMVFSMVADTTANFDTPLLSTSRQVRRALTYGEIASMDTITGQWDGTIASDQHANAYLVFGRGADAVEINEALDLADFRPLDGCLILIRSYIVTDPFHARGVWRLGFDPRDLLLDQGFDRVYDSGAVTAFGR